MAVITVKIRGTGNVRNNFRRRRVAALRGARLGTQLAAARMELQLQRLLRRAGRGRVYTTYFYTDPAGNVRPVGRRAKPHRASAPGDPPAPDTGALLGSIFTVQSNGGLTRRVGVRQRYGVYLEFGTTRMQKRPFMKPAFEQAKGGMLRLIRQQIREAIKAQG